MFNIGFGLTFGYIDPGTGSQIVQVLIAIIVAIPFLLKTFWKKIKMFFSKSKGQQP